MACGIYCPPPPLPPPHLSPPPSHRLRPRPPGLLASCDAPYAPHHCGRHHLGHGPAPGGRTMRTDGNPERKTESHLQEKHKVVVKLKKTHCYQQSFCHLLNISLWLLSHLSHGTCVERTGGAGGGGAALASASRLLTAMTVTM